MNQQLCKNKQKFKLHIFAKYRLYKYNIELLKVEVGRTVTLSIATHIKIMIFQFSANRIYQRKSFLYASRKSKIAFRVFVQKSVSSFHGNMLFSKRKAINSPLSIKYCTIIPQTYLLNQSKLLRHIR